MPNNSVEKALGVDICESGVMQNAIELWHNMYKNEPPWRGGKDNVIPLNLPAAISEEFARLILTEFSMEVTGSPMAAFINEQLKDQLTDLNKFVEITNKYNMNRAQRRQEGKKNKHGKNGAVVTPIGNASGRDNS